MNHGRNALTMPSSLFLSKERMSNRFYGRDAMIGLACARSTRAFPGHALREQRDRSSHLSPSTYPSQRIWKSRGDGGVGLNCARRTSTSRSARSASKEAAPPSPHPHTLFKTSDTPLQSFPNPSETDPYPSTPSSSGPRSGRYQEVLKRVCG